MAEKQTDEALEQRIQPIEVSENFYRSILENSQDLICIARKDGYFEYVNHAWEMVLGYTNEELLSKPFLDFIHPDDHEMNDEEIERLSSGHLSMDFENRYMHKNGTIKTISWRATPIVDENKFYCIGRDITEKFIYR